MSKRDTARLDWLLSREWLSVELSSDIRDIDGVVIGTETAEHRITTRKQIDALMSHPPTQPTQENGT